MFGCPDNSTLIKLRRSGGGVTLCAVLVCGRGGGIGSDGSILEIEGTMGTGGGATGTGGMGSGTLGSLGAENGVLLVVFILWA